MSENISAKVIKTHADGSTDTTDCIIGVDGQQVQLGDEPSEDAQAFLDMLSGTDRGDA